MTNTAAGAPLGVAMFSTGYCPYCVRAEQFLRAKGVSDLQKIMVDQSPQERERMMELSQGRRTVPQIFIAGEHIGGCDDLLALGKSDPERLSALLSAAAAQK